MHVFKKASAKDVCTVSASNATEQSLT